MPFEFRDRRSSRTQFDALSGGVIIATIYRTAQSVMATEQVWHWSFKTTHGPRGFMQHGTAEVTREAQAAVEAQWSRWLAAAGLRCMGR